MSEVAWFPACQWQQRNGVISTEIVRYPELPASVEWEYQAFLCHFVTGLHDVYEHTFDSWDRHENVSGVELIATDYRVVDAAKRLKVDNWIADQWLAFRALQTHLPYPLVAFLSAEMQCTAHVPVISETQPERAGMVCPFSWVDHGVTIENPAWHPGLNSHASNFFDAALTWNEIPWQVLFTTDGETRLILRPEGLAELRRALMSDDVTRRIGTIPEGAFSDLALTLILEARIKNLVAPAPLWEALLAGANPISDQADWQLPLPAFTMPDYENAA